MSRTFHPAGLAMVALEQADDLEKLERFVLSTLCLHADKDGSAYPGIARISKLTGISRRCVVEKLQSLVARGVVEVIKQGGGSGRATVYRINGAALAPFNGAPGAPFETVRVHETVHGTTKNGAGPAPQHKEDRNTARVPARELSDFLEKGLTALAYQHPDLARAWSDRINGAHLEDDTLIIGTKTSHAERHLENYHAEELRAAFAPDASRVICRVRTGAS